MNKFYTLKQIETPRLIIRPVQLGDEIQLNQAVNNSLESLQQWMPWANDPSLETTRDFIQKGVFAKSSQSIADFPMVVVHKEDQKIISGSGYNDRSDPKNGLYEIGYWCDVDYQGKGYVTEYVNALTKYALEELKAKIVVIRMEVDNSKSIAVAERLNFKKQGTKPSVTKDNATDYYFTCESIKLLPPLDSSWRYEENKSNDAKIIAWAKNELNISDEKIFAESKMLLKTPWSSVMAVNTAAGTVYLKHMPEKIALEADIIKHLKNKFNASVPEVIADNKELNSFLMKDAGISLRTILKKKFNVDLMCEAIDQFTKLQISIGNNVESLLELGVPDWRLNKMPDLYKKAISQKDLLMADGLSESEINELEDLLPKISDL
ncbi:MAG: GNAT family N-acetyltransferase, partial [Rickettsiaceae bacterium]